MSIDTPLLLDIALCIILLVAFIIGAKRGLLKSLLGVAIFGVSFVGASWCANELAAPVTAWIQPKVEQRILEQLSQRQFGGEMSKAMGALDLNSLDLQSIDLSSLHLGGLMDKLKNVLLEIQASGGTMVSGALKQMLTQVVHAALFLVIFLVLLLVLWLVTRPLKLATYADAFRTADAVAGGVLGLAGGVIVIFVVAWVARKLGFITADMVAQTRVTRYFIGGDFLNAVMDFGNKF